ncbi:MAG: ATP-binding protein [Actinomycetota bacterium]|nr:ATP-binding protein [Actinomycetota bacterium]
MITRTRIRALLPEGGTLPDEAWRSRHRGVLGLLWVHVAALFLFALACGNGVVHALLDAGLVALPALAAQASTTRRRQSTLLASVGLMTASAVLVHLSGGAIEAHFHFFVMVGVVVLYQQWAPFLVAIGFVFIHHGVMGVLDPHALYNHSDAWAHPWTWAAIHGFSILAMSAVGITTWRLDEALRRDIGRRESLLAEAEQIARVGSWEWDTATDEPDRWSDELFRILGLPLDAPTSYASFTSRVHPADRHLLDEAMARIDGGERFFTSEFRVVFDDGSVHWVRSRGEVSREAQNGVGPRVNGTCQDITEAAESDRARRRSEQRYRGIVETAQEGIWAFDASYRTIFVNSRIADMLGYHVEDMVGQSLSVLVRDWGRDIAVSPLAAPVDGQQAAYEVTLRRRDGSEMLAHLFISWSANPDVGGGLEGLAIVNDITARKQSEEALALAFDEAIAASELKSQFLANTSHEIRTPITVVLGMNELLLETELDPTQRKFAEGVGRAAGSLLAIINDILDFSKIEAGRLDLELADMELRPLVDEVGELLSDRARAKGLLLAWRCAPDVPDRVYGDASRLRQILLNLASNAVKFTDAGAVDMRLSLVHLAAGDVVRFEVVDTGIGISDDDQRRLFQPFSQVDASSTRRFGGTGLGLAICSMLVEAMGGRIGVTSTAGAGSTFWFEMPFEALPVRSLSPV